MAGHKGTGYAETRFKTTPTNYWDRTRNLRVATRVQVTCETVNPRALVHGHDYAVYCMYTKEVAAYMHTQGRRQGSSDHLRGSSQCRDGEYSSTTEFVIQ